VGGGAHACVQVARLPVNEIAWLQHQQSRDGAISQDILLPLQLSVLRFGFFQDGDVGVCVFPESEEIFVGGERSDAGRIGIRSLRVLDCKALARATPRCASAPVQQFQTMPVWSIIF
jgi:hypothetical protein